MVRPSRRVASTNAQTATPQLLDETAAPTALTSITFVATAFFKTPIFKCILAASIGYLATRLVKKLFDGYTFMRTLQSISNKAHETVPYVNLLATAVVLLLCNYFQTIAIVVAMTVAVLSGLTVDNYSMNAIYDTVAATSS